MTVCSRCKLETRPEDLLPSGECRFHDRDTVVNPVDEVPVRGPVPALPSITIQDDSWDPLLLKRGDEVRDIGYGLLYIVDHVDVLHTMAKVIPVHERDAWERGTTHTFVWYGLHWLRPVKTAGSTTKTPHHPPQTLATGVGNVTDDRHDIRHDDPSHDLVKRDTRAVDSDTLVNVRHVITHPLLRNRAPATLDKWHDVAVKRGTSITATPVPENPLDIFTQDVYVKGYRADVERIAELVHWDLTTSQVTRLRHVLETHAWYWRDGK